jgi:hypothetical protein
MTLPRRVNALLIAASLVVIASPLSLLIGPGQCLDAAAAWFAWQNLKAMFRSRGDGTARPKVEKEEADVSPV